MARAAGDSPNYTFVLWDQSANRYRKDVVLSFPSTSTIVKRVLAAPQLVPWAYKITRDNIAGLVSVLRQHPEAEIDEVLDMLEDGDWLDEVLKENGLRPDDVRDERADEGTREHKTLERLANVAMDDHDHAMMLAQKLWDDSHNGYERAIGWWFVETSPQVVASEEVLPCPAFGFCGTTDLVWYDRNMVKVVTDLKTRAAGREVYISDEFQVDGYWTAYDLRHPETPAGRGSVLVAREDGTWLEKTVSLPHGAFLELKKIDDIVRDPTRKDR